MDREYKNLYRMRNKDLDPYYGTFTAEDLYWNSKNTGCTLPDRRGSKTKPIHSIWTRDPASVTDDQYNDFYRRMVKHGFLHSIWMDHSQFVGPFTNEECNRIRALTVAVDCDPLAKSHLHVRGGVNYKLLLYIPRVDSKEPFSPYGSVAINFKFYVQDCLLTDNFQYFLPHYLDFIRGVVDTDDLPYDALLSTLVDLELFKLLKKDVTSKILDLLESMDERKLFHFRSIFGKNIKTGIEEDPDNRSRLAKLLRFRTSGLPNGGFTSLKDYVERVKDNQKYIYFMHGQGADEPIVEKLKQQGYEILSLTDPEDVSCLSILGGFSGKKILNVTEVEGEETRNKFEPLINWIKENILKGSETEVAISLELTDLPCVITYCKQDGKKKKEIQLNPKNPGIVKVLQRVNDNPQDESINRAIEVLLQLANHENTLSKSKVK